MGNHDQTAEDTHLRGVVRAETVTLRNGFAAAVMGSNEAQVASGGALLIAAGNTMQVNGGGAGALLAGTGVFLSLWWNRGPAVDRHSSNAKLR